MGEDQRWTAGREVPFMLGCGRLLYVKQVKTERRFDENHSHQDEQDHAHLVPEHLKEKIQGMPL